MQITTLNTDATVLAELGSRLASTRLERNVSQEQLAREAGVSKSTVERLEAGHEVRLARFVRVLRALGLLERLDAMIPEPLPSPVERLKMRGRQRQRAAGSRGGEKSGEGGSWTWAEAGAESSEPG
jgi:transcriptional regulator with XRE-family HTH domain